ncbi:MAG: protein kinase [bacterium]|nr:MAG: protein kinase [bacterium]
MIGKTISHYNIIEEIGRGGMGVVYKAEDTKLHRTVALKFLPPEFTRDPEAKERFSHEAQAAAALNHTNICTIYEIDEHEGQSFIAMEHIEGRGLKSIIAERPLELATTLDIAMQIAEGLAEAHEKDVIHRDIKPANIMITGKGQVKIMDFGLAKLRSQTVLTKEGTTLGTVAYMSPEQARGRPADQRTDLWSLGVVLYEMVAGKRPFAGEYDQAMIYSVLNVEPEPLTAVRSGVPPELERIVNKSLEKDPTERYQTAAGLIADLRHLRRIMGEGVETSRSIGPQSHVQPPSMQQPFGQQPSVQQPSMQQAPARRKMRWLPWLIVIALAVIIAAALFQRYFRPSKEATEERPTSDLKMLVVLPFANLGPPEDGYFADGITDAITARIAGLSGLGVISRQSAIQYKGRAKSTREISEELGVDYILEGTIQRERPNDPQSRVRIIPQLIRCADDIHLWADTYDEDMTEVFHVQSEIAERVAHELDVTLLEPERRALAAKPTENLEAYEFYLRGIEYADRRVNEEAARQSIHMFRKAVDLDPEFSVAWAQLSRAYTWSFWMMDDPEGIAKAREAADEAMRIDPDFLDGHLALGFIYYYGSRDYDRALDHFLRVQKQRPGDADANKAIGYIKRRQGKMEEALSHFERAIKIDPRGYMLHYDNFGNTLMMLRRYDEAEKYIDRAISLVPDLPIPYLSKAQIIINRDGNKEKAKLYLEEAFERVKPDEACSYLALTEYSIFRICIDSPCRIVDQMDLTTCDPTNAIESASFYIARAQCNLRRDRNQEAVALLDSARVILERNIQGEGFNISYSYSMLGVVNALLGRREDAIHAGERAVELLPISKDVFDGTALAITLAEIYAIVGEFEAAIDQLEILLSIPAEISVQAIRLDPVWDPLRNNPRFQQLLEKYSKGS